MASEVGVFSLGYIELHEMQLGSSTRHSVQHRVNAAHMLTLLS